MYAWLTCILEHNFITNLCPCKGKTFAFCPISLVRAFRSNEPHLGAVVLKFRSKFFERRLIFLQFVVGPIFSENLALRLNDALIAESLLKRKATDTVSDACTEHTGSNVTRIVLASLSTLSYVSTLALNWKWWSF